MRDCIIGYSGVLPSLFMEEVDWRKKSRGMQFKQIWDKKREWMERAIGRRRCGR